MDDRKKLMELHIILCRSLSATYDEAQRAPVIDLLKTAENLIANGVVVREKGEWELLPGGFKWRCTACGSKVSLDGSPEENGLYFCHNCGADMTGGDRRV